MAVPKEVNSFVEEDDVNALFEYNAVEYEDYPEFDLLLADFAAAAKSGDVVALATAIGTISFLLRCCTSTIFFLKLRCRCFGFFLTSHHCMSYLY